MSDALPPGCSRTRSSAPGAASGRSARSHEIIGLGAPLPDGDRRMRVRVIESGEHVDHRLAEILDDPRER